MNADFAFPSLRSILLLPVLESLAAGCGGGGGDDEDDGPDVPGADATGVYRGTATPDGGTSSPANLIVAPGGQFQLVTSVALFAGTGTTDGMEFSANATGYAPAGTSFPSGATTGNFSLMGTVVERSRVSGTFSGAGLSGRVSLDFRRDRHQPTGIVAGAGRQLPGSGSARRTVGELCNHEQWRRDVELERRMRRQRELPGDPGEREHLQLERDFQFLPRGVAERNVYRARVHADRQPARRLGQQLGGGSRIFGDQVGASGRANRSRPVRVDCRACAKQIYAADAGT